MIMATRKSCIKTFLLHTDLKQFRPMLGFFEEINKFSIRTSRTGNKRICIVKCESISSQM